MGRRADRRLMLAEIALLELPAPREIAFSTDGFVRLTFDRIAEGTAWIEHFGGEVLVRTHHGRRWLTEAIGRRRGWDLTCWAAEELPEAVPLPEKVTADLSSLIAADQVAA
jgi:hypothetical protein